MEAETDGNPWRNRSHSDELLQSMGSSPSTDSFLMEGEKKMRLQVLCFCEHLSKGMFSKGHKVENILCSFEKNSVSWCLFGMASSD